MRCWYSCLGPEGPQMLAKGLDLGVGAMRRSQVPYLPPAMPAAPAWHCLSAGQQPHGPSEWAAVPKLPLAVILMLGFQGHRDPPLK